MPLTNAQVRQLKSLAQRLDPILMVGKAGLTEEFLASIQRVLNDHELIKVKFAAFKEQKASLSAEIAARSGSELVWIIGHVAIFYREHPAPGRRKVLPEQSDE